MDEIFAFGVEVGQEAGEINWKKKKTKKTAKIKIRNIMISVILAIQCKEYKKKRLCSTRTESNTENNVDRHQKQALRQILTHIQIHILSPTL